MPSFANVTSLEMQSVHIKCSNADIKQTEGAEVKRFRNGMPYTWVNDVYKEHKIPAKIFLLCVFQNIYALKGICANISDMIT